MLRTTTLSLALLLVLVPVGMIEKTGASQFDFAYIQDVATSNIVYSGRSQQSSQPEPTRTAMLTSTTQIFGPGQMPVLAQQTLCGDEEDIRQAIERWKSTLNTTPWPEYLPDSSIITAVLSFQIQAYEELYFSTIDLRSLTSDSLSYARRSLDQGDVESACKYLERAKRSISLMLETDSTAALVWQDQVANVSELIRSIYEWSRASVTFGVGAQLGPKASLVVEMFYLPLDYVNDRAMYGEQEAARRLKDRVLTEVLVEVILKTIPIPSLGNKTINAWISEGVNHQIGASRVYSILDEALDDPNLQQEILKALAFVGRELSNETIQRLTVKLVQELRDAVVQPSEPTAPMVVSTSPTRSAANVSRNISTLTVTFGENIQAGNRAVTITDSGGAPVSISAVAVGTNTLTISLPALLDPKTVYAVTIETGAVRDLAGRPNQPYDWTFTTNAPGLYAGADVTVANTGGVGLRLRSEPGLSGRIITTLRERTIMTIMGGPVLVDGYTWWYVTGNTGSGWSAVGDWLSPTDSDGLRIGAEVTVANTGGVGLRLRSEPGLSGRAITTLPEGTEMTIIGGPYYIDGHAWWNITGSTGTGWSAVAYWLFPLSVTSCLISYSDYPESAHAYENNFDRTWWYTCSGASSLLVTFDSRTKVERGYDFIYVMDGNRNSIPGSPFTGSELAGQTKIVPGNFVMIRLRTDSSVMDWGFKVTEIRGVTCDSCPVIFAVYPPTTYWDPIIEPIVLIDQDGYVQPPWGYDSEEPINQLSIDFASTYYRPGRKYRLLYGGSEVGTVSVTEWTQIACVSLAARVELQTSANLDQHALATNSNSLGRQRGSRRAPTTSEQAAMMGLAQEVYRQNGVPTSLLQSIETINLAAVDLNSDGTNELIGNFRITASPYTLHELFLIAELQGSSYSAGLKWYHRSDDIDCKDCEVQELVDVLDLDGDSTDEVIVVHGFYEYWEYKIYKKQSGQWREIYRGGGGGC